MDSQVVPNRSRSRATGIFAWALPALVLLVTFAVMDMPILRSDGVAYYAWLHAFVDRGTVSLSAEYQLFRPLQLNLMFPVPETGRIGSMLPFGSALIWAPLYTLFLRFAHSSFYLGYVAPYFDNAGYLRKQLIDFAPGLAVTLATNVLMLATAYLALDVARRRTSILVASLATVAVFLGTPLIYYSSMEPAMAHVPGAFVTALIYWLFFRFGMYRERSQPERTSVWLLIGLGLGLAITVRWQLCLLGLPFAAVLAHQRRWRSLAALAAGVFLLAWTVPWSWNYMFGRPLVVPASPNDPGKFLVGPKNLLNVWFSPLHGLFTWSPIVALSILGAALWFRRDRQTAFIIGSAFLLLSLMAASIWDWWGGASFGMRRLAELYPLYVLGLAFLFQAARESLSARPWSRSAQALSAGLLCLLPILAVGWASFLLLAYAGAKIHYETGTTTDALRLGLAWGADPGHTAQVIFDGVRAAFLYRSRPTG